jgi:hypothetical protein
MNKTTKVVNGKTFEQVYPRPQSSETLISHGRELQTGDGEYLGTFTGREMRSFFDSDGNPHTLLVGDVVREYPAPAKYWVCVE